MGKEKTKEREEREGGKREKMKRRVEENDQRSEERNGNV